MPVTPQHQMMHTGRRRNADGGFSLVEVIVALFILVLIVGGVMVATGGALHLQGTVRVRERMTNAAQAAYEVVRSDHSWMPDCPPTCPNKPITLDTSSLHLGSTLKDKDLDTTFVLDDATATPVDSTADNDPATATGKDLDGNRIDYYHVQLTLRLDKEATKRLGKQTPIVINANIDPSSSADNGSLVVQFCSVWNQIDERMAISNCSDGTMDARMQRCPANSKPGCHAYTFVNDTFSAPANTSPTPYLRVKADTGMTFTITKTDKPHKGLKRNQVDATMFEKGFLFQNIPAGQYDIEFQTPVGFEHWGSHDIPTADADGGDSSLVSVETRARSRALIMFRRTTTGAFTLNFERTIEKFTWSGSSMSKVGPPRSKSWTTGTSCRSLGVEDGRICSKVVHVNHWQDTHTWKFYTHSTSTEVLQGANQATTFAMRPEPLGRTGRGSGCGGWAPASCKNVTGTTVSSGGDVTSGTKSIMLDKLPTGINSAPRKMTDADMHQVSGYGNGYVWVQPDTGGIYAGPGTQTWSGKGECYTSIFGTTTASWDCSGSCVKWAFLGNQTLCGAAIVYSICSVRSSTSSYTTTRTYIPTSGSSTTKVFSGSHPNEPREHCRPDVSLVAPRVCSSIVGGCVDADSIQTEQKYEYTATGGGESVPVEESTDSDVMAAS